MSYEIAVQETIWTKISVGNTDFNTALDLIAVTAQPPFNRKTAEYCIKQTGSYTFSNGNKMITIKYVSDFKGQ